MSKGVLVDTTRCIGCRGCQVACKQANDMPAEQTTYNPDWSNPRRFSSRTLTFVDFRPATRTSEKVAWNFVKRQCMHCEDPACVSSCLVGALRKTGEGPVIYDRDRCIGCRYCMVACPFDVLTYQWDQAIPYVVKCTFCADRQAAGLAPACASTCPTGTLKFGERDALLREANSRIYSQPGKYVPHIYGEREAGGTSWLYISDVPIKQTGLPTYVNQTPIPELSKTFLLSVPLVLIVWPAALAGLNALVKLRGRGANIESHDGEGGE